MKKQLKQSTARFKVLVSSVPWTFDSKGSAKDTWNGFRKEDKTFEEAIRTAFDAMAIELRKYREKRASTEVRTPPIPPLRGVICKLFPKEGYGFILKEGGGEVYFHKHALQGLTFEELNDGTDVALTLKRARKALRLQRSNVRPPSSCRNLHGR